MINLRADFPFSRLHLIRRNWKLVGTTALVLAIQLLAEVQLLRTNIKDINTSLIYTMDWGLGYLFLAMLGICLIKFIYDFLYYRKFVFGIDEDNFVLIFGLFTHHEHVIPLSRMSGISVDKNFLDVLMGLADVTVSAPFDVTDRYIKLSGFSYFTARMLENYLVGLVPEGVEVPREKHLEENQVNEMPYNPTSESSLTGKHRKDEGSRRSKYLKSKVFPPEIDDIDT